MKDDVEKQLNVETELPVDNVQRNQQSPATPPDAHLDGPEAQMPGARNIENGRKDDVISEVTSGVTNSEGPVTIEPPNLIANKGAGELGELTTNTQTPQSETCQPARRGPMGPKTELGRKRSSKNAVKSGIFSGTVLTRGESLSEYQRVLNGLREALQPVGMLEENLVEKLATISWRYRRLLIAEVAEIRKNTEFR